MPLVDAGEDPPSPDAIHAALAALRAGGVVGLPTDTVYGLAVDPSVPGATAALFSLKGRPSTTPLPVLVSGIEQAEQLGIFGVGSRSLAEALWPGALTIVVERHRAARMDLGGSTATIGLRCPSHSVPRELCRRSGPVAATSANRHGEPDLASAAEVAEAFPGLLILDGGECRGVSSTVVDATGEEPLLLRAGALAWGEILRTWRRGS